MLSNEAIEEFKKIYLKKYGIELSPDEAVEYSRKLIELYKIVLSKEVNSNEKEI